LRNLNFSHFQILNVWSLSSIIFLQLDLLLISPNSFAYSKPVYLLVLKKHFYFLFEHIYFASSETIND
ncbi:MAG: hypothetical protein ACK55Z_01890, partial [bacterium]